MVKRIVLTGGPCAGKTSVLKRIKDCLSDKGYCVYIVPESATELMKSGITPHKTGVGMLNFQRLVLFYQYQKEELYNMAASMQEDKEIVIIYDRGVMDNKAYVSDIEFGVLLHELSLKLGKKIDELDLVSRYDMIIHLETSAGKKGYNLESNNVRYEDEEEAILLDKKTRLSWQCHNNLNVVESSDVFEDKMSNVIKIVLDFVCDKKHTNKMLIRRKKQ